MHRKMEQVEAALRAILADDKARREDWRKATWFANVPAANDCCCCPESGQVYCAYNDKQMQLLSPG